MDLMNEKLGAEGEVSLVIEAGKLSLVAKYDSKGLDGEVKLSVSSDYFIDKLKEKIPGQIDDAVLEILKGALKAM